MKNNIKRIVGFAFLAISYSATAMSPLEVVNGRMAAHNDHDIEQFLLYYSENIQVYDFPNVKLGNGGKDHIRKIFKPLFESKSVKTEIRSQMVNGKYVVNRETVVREGKTTEYISIYEVENELIQSVRFIK